MTPFDPPAIGAANIFKNIVSNWGALQANERESAARTRFFPSPRAAAGRGSEARRGNDRTHPPLEGRVAHRRCAGWGERFDVACKRRMRTHPLPLASLATSPLQGEVKMAAPRE